MKFLEKLKSRKFIAAAVGVAMGIAMVFGMDESTLRAVTGAAVSVVSLVTYIITEGRVDAAAIEKTLVAVEKAVKEVEGK